MPTPSSSQVAIEKATRCGRVWDAPVRVFHWLLVSCFAITWLTREMPQVDLHAAAGYAMFGLITFRLFWGFIGSRPARFSSFAYSPQAAVDYLRGSIAGTAPEYLGHNPAGSWSIYLLLASGLAAALSGIFLLGAEHGFGPMSGAVHASAAPAIHTLHETIAWAMLALFVAHLAGVAYGSFSHRQNLIGAMISGNKRRVPPDFPTVPSHLPVALALFGGVLGAACGYLYLTGWTDAYASLRQQAKAAGATVSPWTEECSSCHLPYPAEFLPARSWKRMLAEQGEHFGDDLGLTAGKLAALDEFAVRGAATPNWAGMMLQASVAADASPQRITETDFWRKRHRRIDDARFKSDKVAGKHDCEACHADALSGIFSPRLIQIPDGRPKS